MGPDMVVFCSFGLLAQDAFLEMVPWMMGDCQTNSAEGGNMRWVDARSRFVMWFKHLVRLCSGGSLIIYFIISCYLQVAVNLNWAHPVLRLRLVIRNPHFVDRVYI